MSFCLIILAGGNSHRFRSKVGKPYQKLAGKSLIEINVIKARKFKQIKKIILVYNKKDTNRVKSLKLKNVKLVTGGITRQQSTFNGLKNLKNEKGISKVLIHDVARPNFSLRLFRSIITNMKNARAVVPKIRVQDAIKQIIESSKEEYIVGKRRDNLFLTQTPQAFTLKEIYHLHKTNSGKYKDDDISLYMDLNKVKFIEGEKSNFKITDRSDFENLKSIYKFKQSVGIGFDVHRLIKNKKLYLGGIKIPFHSGLKGHSDGDVILHSIIDALLGAMRKKDIGTFFPDNKNKFKNIRSPKMLEPIIEILYKNNFYINNLDINLICEQPKISKHRDKIINSLSNLLDLNKDLINLKGKTAEKLGLIGKEKAIACEVICSISK